MLTYLLGFELKYHVRQITFIVSAVLFIALGLLMIQGNFGGAELHKNGPYVISYLTCFLSLMVIFISTLFCANVVLRDTVYRMDAIIFTTSLEPLPYFMTRLLGLVLTVFIVLALGVSGIALGSMAAGTDQLGPYNFLYFLQPLLVFGLPNVLFCCSVIFSVALLTRQVRAVYIAGVLLFILYFLGSILGNSPMMASSLKTSEPGLLPYLLDPFGLAAFMYDTRAWSLSDRNDRLFPLAGAFLANRLLWTIISCSLLWVAYRYFKFRLPVAEKARKRTATTTTTNVIPYRSVATTSAGVTYNRLTFTAQLKLEVASVCRHIPFLVMMALWVFLYAVELKENILQGPYGTRFYAATGYIVEELRSIRPALLLLIFYAGELISRERAANMEGLVFTTPVRNAILWGAKCATLAVLVALLITANITIGIGLQLLTGYTAIDLPAYLSLYYYSGLPLFLFAVLIVFIQTIVANKYLGMLLSLVIVGIVVFSRQLGIQHYLLRYATLPDLRYTLMNGFGHYTKAVHWYLLYWTSFAAVLSLLAAALWKASAHTTLWQRMQTMGRQWGLTGKVLLVACLLCCTAAGMYIERRTTQVSTARGNSTMQLWGVEYEKRYKPQEHLPQPYIIAVKTHIALYPEEGRYTVQGSYGLRNESSQPITTLWFGVDPEVTSVSFTVPGAAIAKTDPMFRMYWYTLAQPLLPGKEMNVQFNMEVERSSFDRFNPEHSIVDNGSYVELEKYIPYLGYNNRFEAGDIAVRKQHSLPLQTTGIVRDSSYHFINYETVISTAADQQVVTVGALQREWIDGNRRFFHYKTEQPVNCMLAFSSARYAVQKEVHRNITFRIYYQPGHSANLPSIMQAMKDAIDYGSEHFSVYPLSWLTLAEIPQYPGAATAYPGVLFSTEKINFMSNLSDSNRFNNVYAVTAHEVGHQWWANKLSPLPLPGRAVLTESLAKYTEMMVAEKRYGRQLLRQLSLADNNLYFALRYIAGEPEQPLIRADQSFVCYQKGGRTLYGIKEMLGEAAMDTALQRLIAQHGFPQRRATTSDLLRQLNAVATPQQATHINDLFNRVIVYNNAIEVQQFDSLPDGHYRLRVKISVQKTSENDGQLHTMPPHDWMTLAVYDGAGQTGQPAGRLLYHQQHLFTGTPAILTLHLPRRPAQVILDPGAFLSDADLSDNEQKVSAQPK
ncbi:MAG: hypothetical protein J7621_21530 [Niastella sp.]|nr:hypothetical protein [Niastella sp.]